MTRSSESQGEDQPHEDQHATVTCCSKYDGAMKRQGLLHGTDRVMQQLVARSWKLPSTQAPQPLPSVSRNDRKSKLFLEEARETDAPCSQLR